MTLFVVRVAVLVAILAVWVPEVQGHKHRIRIVVPHKITHVHHHHHHPKRLLRHHHPDDHDPYAQDHQEARLGPPRYAAPASNRLHRRSPLFYRHFLRKRTEPPRRYFEYEDDFRRWPEEEEYFDSEEYR